MQVTHAGLVEIERSEGFSSKPYWDAIGARWTRGYGQTRGITQQSPAITRAQAERELIVSFNADYAFALAPFVRMHGFNQNMYDALASFVWNCGPGAVSTTTTVGRYLHAGQWRQAADAMLAWDTSRGVFVQGLRDRRVRERALFLSPVHGASSSPTHPAAYYLTSWEKATVMRLEAERRSAHRHGGWRHIDSSHLRRASRAKADLRARVRLLRKFGDSQHHRKERIQVLTHVIG